MQETMPEVWFPHLGIQIHELGNVAFTVFGAPVYWYGVIIGTGVMCGLLLALREARRTGQNPEQYLDFTMIAMVLSMIGARLYYVAFRWESYQNNLLDIFNLRGGGLAIYGGVIAAIATAVFYTRKKKMDFWLFADTAAPSLLFGQMLGRWGNFFNKEAFGGYTDSLFAMRYLKSDVRAGDLTPGILDHLVQINGVEYIQVHPTFLYESLWSLALFAILFYLQRKKKVSGEVFALYLLGYGVGRFWIEGLRTDQLLLWGTGIPVSQAVSVLLIGIAAAILVIRFRAAKVRRQE